MNLRSALRRSASAPVDEVDAPPARWAPPAEVRPVAPVVSVDLGEAPPRWTAPAPVETSAPVPVAPVDFDPSDAPPRWAPSASGPVDVLASDLRTGLAGRLVLLPSGLAGDLVEAAWFGSSSVRVDVRNGSGLRSEIVDAGAVVRVSTI